MGIHDSRVWGKNAFMGGTTFSRAVVAAGAAAALALGAPAASHADDTVVVRGTAFPDANAQLAYVGCTDLLAPDASQPLQPYIGRGPGEAPAGARSLGYDLAGGTAIGSQHVVSSVIGNNIATLGVFAPEGATGLAVVGYQSPLDQGTMAMWLGVAPVSAPAGQWTTVAATPRAYTWTKYDMSTRTVLETALGAATPVGEFVGAHGGDGPGLYAITFGCDGAPFSMDAMRIGTPGDVTTYDIEGLATAVSMSGVDGQDRRGRGGDPAGCPQVIDRRPDPVGDGDPRAPPGRRWPLGERARGPGRRGRPDRADRPHGDRGVPLAVRGPAARRGRRVSDVPGRGGPGRHPRTDTDTDPGPDTGPHAHAHAHARPVADSHPAAASVGDAESGAVAEPSPRARHPARATRPSRPRRQPPTRLLRLSLDRPDPGLGSEHVQPIGELGQR